MSMMLSSSTNGSGRGPPDRRSKPDAFAGGRGRSRRRGRKRRRQSRSSQRDATSPPPTDQDEAGRGRKQQREIPAPASVAGSKSGGTGSRPRLAPGPSRRSERHAGSSPFASHNRTDTAQRRSTRTVDSPSNYSSANMLHQHLSNCRNRPAGPTASTSTAPTAHSSTRASRRNTAPVTSSLQTVTTTTTTSMMMTTTSTSAATVSAPVDGTDRVIVIEDTPVPEGIADMNADSEYSASEYAETRFTCDSEVLLLDYDYPYKFDTPEWAKQTPPPATSTHDNTERSSSAVMEGSSSNPFLVDWVPAPPDFRITSTHNDAERSGSAVMEGSSSNPLIVESVPATPDIRTIVAQEVGALEERMLARIIEFLNAHMIPDPQDKGKGRAI
ncbi:hypothetical protein BKA70DRAFT_1430526 [Coprinopsis sp. MPI-PUGE-AT-0042]|nr:hypothetical protein BKA70DRAFT_1430526 [Coprinopsis sp. MPI-PUGE-AT-0042]